MSRVSNTARPGAPGMLGARVGLQKLPDEIRDRIPEDLRLKISGQD